MSFQQYNYVATSPVSFLIVDQRGGDPTEINVQSVKVKLSSNTWALLLEQSMLVLIIIARALMPKGDLSKDQLSGTYFTNF